MGSEQRDEKSLGPVASTQRTHTHTYIQTHIHTHTLRRALAVANTPNLIFYVNVITPNMHSLKVPKP